MIAAHPRCKPGHFLRVLEIPNTPVPIPAEAKIGEQQAIVAGNVAYRNLSSSQKQRQRLTLQPRIKWSDKERFHVGRLSAQSSTAKLEVKKRGRPLLFGVYDKMIVNYVRRLRKHGAKVNSKIVMGTARGIIIRKAPQLLHDRGGAKKITRDWALSLLRRIKYVKRKDTRKAKKF